MLHILSNFFISSLQRFMWTFLCSPKTFTTACPVWNGTCDACTSWRWARNTNPNEKWKAVSWRPPCGCLALLNTCLQFPSKSVIPIVVPSCYRQRGQRPRRNVGRLGTSLVSPIDAPWISFQTSPRFILLINHHKSSCKSNSGLEVVEEDWYPMLAKDMPRWSHDVDLWKLVAV